MRIAIALAAALVCGCSASSPSSDPGNDPPSPGDGGAARDGATNPAPLDAPGTPDLDATAPASDAAPFDAGPPRGSLFATCDYDRNVYGPYTCPLVPAFGKCITQHTLDEPDIGDLFLTCTIDCTAAAGKTACASAGGTCRNLTRVSYDGTSPGWVCIAP